MTPNSGENRHWLAASKLQAPARRPDALPRPRLCARMAECLHHSPIMLISAPAGAGKTTLLSELPHVFPETRWAWLLLDSEDNDPVRIATTLAASFEAAGVPAGPLAAGDPRSLITQILNHVEATTGRQRVALVLDDLHTISEASVYELLDYLAGRLPRNLNLVMATRHDPPVSLARRRAHGELAEIRMEDLSFTEAETGALVNERLGLRLPEEDIALLQSRTEGWAAGLRLLATSLATLPGNASTLLQHGMQGRRRIFDFLAEEVLDRQAPDLRRFLLETSILSALDSSVCDALTGRCDSNRLLEDLYRRNLYVVAADQSESTFRYHDLFADFLRDRLRRERPDDWVALHRRAAQVETSPERRIRHLLAAEAWDLAAVAIEETGFSFVSQGFLVTVQRWIGELPEPVRNSHPKVLHLLANMTWLRQEFSQAQPLLKMALEGYRREGNAAGQADVLAALAGAAIMTRRFDESGDLLAEALGFDELAAPARLLIHSLSTWHNVHTLKPDRARTHVEEVFQILESGHGWPDPVALIVVLWTAGWPRGVDRIEGLCATFRARLGAADLASISYYILNSYVLMHRGNIPEASQQLDRAWNLAGQTGQIALLGMTLCYGRMLLAAMRGDWTETEAWASKVLGAEEEYGLIIRNWRLHYLYFRARARWHSGDVAGLRHVYEEAIQPNPAEVPATAPYRFLIAAMSGMADRTYAKAEAAAREALKQEEAFVVTRATCSARTMLAHVLLTRGHADEALDVFLPFLEETCSGNLAGFLLRDNPFVIPLLRRAHEKKFRRDYLERVLELLKAPLVPVAAVNEEALSERELEVFRVLAEGLSNREIASRLFVSEATVKTHVQHILQKLNARSRTEAVARGRELALL